MLSFHHRGAVAGLLLCSSFLVAADDDPSSCSTLKFSMYDEVGQDSYGQYQTKLTTDLFCDDRVEFSLKEQRRATSTKYTTSVAVQNSFEAGTIGLKGFAGTSHKAGGDTSSIIGAGAFYPWESGRWSGYCLLYTSDAADD